MLSVKRLVVEGLARRMGLTVMMRVEEGVWPEERYWREVVTAAKPDCVFDVGANVGDYARRLRTLGFEGTILSFEPAPAPFARLEKQAESDPHWHVHNYALGSVPGSLPFNLMASDLFSSFRQPATNDLEDYVEQNRVVEVINVPVRTLDGVFSDLAARHGFSRPFLKLDTQGFDLEVLNGGEATIANFGGVLSEVAFRRIYDQSPDFIDSIERLRTIGFEVARLFPVDPRNLEQMVESNCYFIRQGWTNSASS